MQTKKLQGEVTSATPMKLRFKVPGNEDENQEMTVNDIELTSTINIAETAKDSAASAGVIPNVKSQESEVVTGDGNNAAVEELPFTIERARPLDPLSFPDLSPKGKPLSTIANAVHLCNSYGVTVRYNVVAKKLLINIPGLSSGSDNYDNSAMTSLLSLAAVNRMPTSQLPSFISAIGDRNQFNPVASWITCKSWDEVDRFPMFCDTLIHHEDCPTFLKRTLLKRWMISAVAAVFQPIGFKTRGVLVLQGPQSIGKTAWIAEMVPDLLLREGVMKLDLHLDPGNKDSVVTAVSAWIVELGELDSSFKKDIARLKGFLTSDYDKLRRPYARTNSEYQRRTVFTATVNESTFLVDTTGNTRWWTIPVTAVNYQHGIDMQQLWAQLKVEFDAGEKWWLTKNEESLLEEQNQGHKVMSVTRERVLEAIDLNRIGEEGLQAMSASQLLMKIGFNNPSNTQCKECAAVLREHFGESKRIKGSEKWRIPLAKAEFFPSDAFKGSASSKGGKTVEDDDGRF